MKMLRLSLVLLVVAFAAHAADHNDPNAINNIFTGNPASGADLYDMFGYPADDKSGGEKVVMALTFADEAIIVTNPEVSSVRDSDRILGIIQAKSRRAQSGSEPVKEHLLITRYSPKRVEAGEMLSYQDVQDILRIPLIGIIPESESVLHASNQGNPAIHFKGTDVADAYEDVIERFMGNKELPLRFHTYEKPGLFKRLLGAK